MRLWKAAILYTSALLCLTGLAGGADVDEFKIKRQEFSAAEGSGFVVKPRVTRAGDRIVIAFETRVACDVTVSIESGKGDIIRHLACGVLGPNAPAPFQKGVLAQSIVWDGKNDRDEYVDNKEACVVRVALGLRPRFEKNLMWEPKRRHGRDAPSLQVAPEGVYVYDGGNGFDFVKLYNHDGSYIRTVYPFPGDKIDQVKGLNRVVYPQDGATLPVKPTFLQQTFLTCGNLYGYAYPTNFALAAMQAGGDCHYGMYGNASAFLAVNGGRLALGKTYLFRMATDGSSGGARVEGPAVALTTAGKASETRGQTIAVAPRGAALSPDGRTLYLTGYLICHYSHASADIIGNGLWETYHVVLKMDLDGDQRPTLFAGSLQMNQSGSDNGSFNVPVSVAVDQKGRVYVADFMNNRVQVFAPDGTFLKSIPVHRPAIVAIAGRSQSIYVFTSLVYNRELVEKQERIKPQLTVFKSFDDPRQTLSCPLPEGFGGSATGFWYGGMGTPLSATVDDHTDPPTIWLADEWVRENVLTRGKIAYRNIELFSLEGGALKSRRSFAKDVARSVKVSQPARYGRARLYLNPLNGKLYVGEGQAFDWKSFKDMIEIDPESGASRIVPLPFDAEDMCFDRQGLAYLRSIGMLVRYDATTWREVPWDYGEEHGGVHTSSSSDRRVAKVASGLALPANGGWHHGGMFVSSRGHLAVACGVNVQPPGGEFATGKVEQPGKAYAPRIYPGRSVDGRGGAPLIHIWDHRGRTLFEDVVPGIGGNTYGLGLDRDNAVYMMSSATRVLDGVRYLNRLSGTLMKVVPGKPKLLSTDKRVPVPLPAAELPGRPIDLVGAGQGPAWADGVEWMYGGVGYDGKNAGVGCGCWNARAAFDFFGRSFAPELDRFRIAVLDANGNLILRIGRYGNGDSAGPSSLVPLGGDEVGLMHGAYLATQTDRRLFVADPSNDRIFSVRLDYEEESKVALAQVPDGGPAAMHRGTGPLQDL